MKTILIWDTRKLFSITVGYTEALTIKPFLLLEKAENCLVELDAL